MHLGEPAPTLLLRFLNRNKAIIKLGLFLNIITSIGFFVGFHFLFFKIWVQFL